MNNSCLLSSICVLLLCFALLCFAHADGELKGRVLGWLVGWMAGWLSGLAGLVMMIEYPCVYVRD